MRLRPWLPALLSLLMAPASWAVEGELTPVAGTVEVMKSGQKEWDTVRTPTSVSQGDRISTSGDSKAFLVMPDDHRVAIGPDTEINLQHMATGETKIFLKKGSIRNKIRPLQVEKGQFYKIQTPAAVVAVRGTDFSVVQMKTAQVYVFEGLVDLSAIKKDVAQAVMQLTAGQGAQMDQAGAIQPMSGPSTPEGTTPAPEGKKDGKDGKDGKEERKDGPDGKPEKGDKQGNETSSKGPRPPGPPGPPPTGQPPVAPGSGWWEGPERMNQEQNLFQPTDAMLKPPLGTVPPPPMLPPPDATLPPPDSLQPPPEFTGTTYNYYPPLIPGGTGTTGDIGTTVGLDALVDTMRSKNLHDQANAILVADLFQRNAVRTDPLTGQLRQYADAIIKVSPDTIRFVNATMLPGVPDSLNYTSAVTRFNAALPTNYWVATKTAFAGDSTPPSWYATEYHTDISNTVDHLTVDAIGGSLITDTDGLYVTEFANISTKINGNLLWAKSGSSFIYRGGSTPTRYQTSTGKADMEVKEVYADGTFLSVRHTFADDGGRIVSTADLPSGINASDFLNTLNVRSTIRSNLLSRGALDIFGSVQGRTLAGLFELDDFDAADILQGIDGPHGAYLGLTKS